MLLQKIATLLTEDIKWGRLAALAAGSALVAVVTASGTLSFLSLVVFSIGGILIDRIAPKRPYWNALVFGLLGIFFYALLFNLSIVGRNQPLPALPLLLQEALSVGIVILPQSLIGAWIGVTIRRIGQGSRGGKDKAEGGAPQKAATPEPSKGKPEPRPTPKKPPARRHGKR